MEANVGEEVAEGGTVAANVEAVVAVPSGNDAFALLEERGIRLENVELEGGSLGDQYLHYNKRSCSSGSSTILLYYHHLFLEALS